MLTISKKRRSAEQIIATLYLYLLPVRMISQLSWFASMLRGAGIYFDVILHGLGVVLYVLTRGGQIPTGRGRSSGLMQYTGFAILALNCSSVIMACIMQAIYGDQGNESAFDGILGMLIYFTQYFLIFWYNREVFRMIGKEALLKILHRLCAALLILGWWQYLIMNVGGFFATVYDRLNIFGIVNPSRQLPKLCLTGSEGAGAGTLLAIFILPILFSRILTEPAGKRRIYIFQVIAWLPPLYMTRSSTAYILATVSFAVFFFYLLRKRKNPAMLIVVSLVFLFVFVLLLFPDTVLEWFPEDIREQISYLLLEKATDLSNGSTVSRTVPLIVNWGAFSEYPILGVGNGLQGYFYPKYFPDWAYHVAGSDVLVFLERSKTGLSNGGVFFPGFLSGYGLLGICLLAGYILKSHELVQNAKEELGPFYYVYKIAVWAILFSGFQGDFYGTYYLWFILSIPFMVGIYDFRTHEPEPASLQEGVSHE